MRQITLLVISLIILSSCATPPDVPVCRALDTKKVIVKSPEFGDLIEVRPNPKCMKEVGEKNCGFCVWTVSNKSQFVGESEKHRLNKKKWSEVQREALITPAYSYAEMKAYVINSCKQSGQCGKEIDHWRIKFDSLDSVFKE